ncbi:hypothetical protein PSACC_02091, partial [Paramicrosporidium saccamoebae]
FRPGWDCHGLPIEIKALAKAQGKSLTPLQIRNISQQFAQDAISSQAAEMKRWGLLADYEHPVRTLDPSYEAAQLRVFGQLVQRGLVYADKRPVYWSPSSRTALAEAELEYVDGHISKACFVKFPIVGTLDEYLLIWTTTPWTIPANQAIAVNPMLNYVRVNAGREKYIVAQSRMDDLKDMFETAHAAEAVSIESLLNTKYKNLSGNCNPVVVGDFVTNDVGTGLVHLSPAYGQDDFATCRKHGIVEQEIVDMNGMYTDAAPAELAGKSITDVDVQLELLRTKGLLLHSYDHRHRYPYDWRTKKPVIQMATRQWFIRTGPILAELHAALEPVQFLPASGKKRLANMLDARQEWCISRQRVWGVPIPVFYDKETDSPLLDVAVIEHFANLVAQNGTNAWWELDNIDLLPDQFKHLADRLVRGNDTIDVWFDSGTFWSSTTDPSDIYIEGTDQHRGWFQSSLITSVVSRGISPFKKLVSHGFVLDERGNKMSKSVGNVIAPDEIIKGTGKLPRGTDVLRLWAVSSNFLSDVTVGPILLERTVELHQKLRNTFRFILGNLVAFPGSLKWEELKDVDRLVLSKCETIKQQVQQKYDELDFSGGIAVLQAFVIEDLSAFYFDVIKNRLYIDTAHSLGRQSAQTALGQIALRLLSLLRPVSPYLCAEFGTVDAGSVCNENRIEPSQKRAVIRHVECGLDVYRLLESTYQADIELSDTEAGWDDLAEIFMVNSVRRHYGNQPALSVVEIEGLGLVRILRAEHGKCPRCWMYRLETDEEICRPCNRVLNLGEVLANEN